VRAGSVQVGDKLVGLDASSVKVIQRTIISKEGIYAPLTASGRIVVNGLMASSYISLQKEAVMYSQLGADGWLELPLSQQDLCHYWMAPLRMMCTASHANKAAFCDRHDSEGYLHWVSLGIRLLRWLERQYLVVQIILLAAAVVALGILALIEDFMSTVLGGTVLMLLLTFGVYRSSERSRHFISTLGSSATASTCRTH